MIIREYSPRRSRGEYFPIITSPSTNNYCSIFTQVSCVLGTEFILISFISFSNFDKTASRHFANFDFGQFDQSTCRICYIYLCKNTISTYSYFEFQIQYSRTSYPCIPFEALRDRNEKVKLTSKENLMSFEVD